MDKQKIIERLVNEISFTCSTCKYDSSKCLELGQYCKAQLDMINKYYEIFNEFGMK